MEAKCRYCSTPGCRGECKAAERETIIHFDDAKPEVIHVYTAHPAWRRKLAKHPHAQQTAAHQAENGTVTGEEFDLPRWCLSLRRKRPTGSPASEATRERLRRARLARQTRAPAASAAGAAMAAEPQKLYPPVENHAGGPADGVPAFTASRERARRGPLVHQTDGSAPSEPSATTASSATRLYSRVENGKTRAQEGTQIPLTTAEVSRG